MTSQESSLWTWRVQITISPNINKLGLLFIIIIISHLAFNLIKSCLSPPLIPDSPPSAESMYQCSGQCPVTRDWNKYTWLFLLLRRMWPWRGFYDNCRTRCQYKDWRSQVFWVLSSLRVAVSVWSWDWSLNSLVPTVSPRPEQYNTGHCLLSPLSLLPL